MPYHPHITEADLIHIAFIYDDLDGLYEWRDTFAIMWVLSANNNYRKHA